MVPVAIIILIGLGTLAILLFLGVTWWQRQLNELRDDNELLKKQRIEDMKIVAEIGKGADIILKKVDSVADELDNVKRLLFSKSHV